MSTSCFKEEHYICIYIPIWWRGYETGRTNESVSCRLAALLELAAAGLSTGSMQLIASHFLQKNPSHRLTLLRFGETDNPRSGRWYLNSLYELLSCAVRMLYTAFMFSHGHGLGFGKDLRSNRGDSKRSDRLQLVGWMGRRRWVCFTYTYKYTGVCPWKRRPNAHLSRPPLCMLTSIGLLHAYSILVH